MLIMNFCLLSGVKYLINKGCLKILYNIPEKHGLRHEPNSIYFLIIWLANVAVWSMIYIAEILRYEPEDLLRQWWWCSISNHCSD